MAWVWALELAQAWAPGLEWALAKGWLQASAPEWGATLALESERGLHSPPVY